MRNLLILICILICFCLSQVVVAQKRPVNKQKSAPKIISCGVCNQKAIFLPKPEYPETARLVNLSGQVRVHILIDERGNVESAKAFSGHPFLRSASVKAALQAKFDPFLLGKKPVKVIGTIVYDFSR